MSTRGPWLITAGAFVLAAALTAEAERAQRGLIQTNYLGTRTILVANPKSGSRKTTSTWMLGHTMGTSARPL